MGRNKYKKPTKTDLSYKNQIEIIRNNIELYEKNIREYEIMLDELNASIEKAREASYNLMGDIQKEMAEERKNEKKARIWRNFFA